MRKAIACCALSAALLAGVPAVAFADDAGQDTKTEAVEVAVEGDNSIDGSPSSESSSSSEGSSSSSESPSASSGSASPGSSAVGKEMFRLYNQYSGEHLYTADAAERDALEGAGWIYEGVAWTAPDESATPVYRLYNSYEPLGDHHYTTDAGEYANLAEVGWTQEGAAWYSDDAKGEWLLRMYNPNAYPSGMSGAHHYTASLSEAMNLASLGWSYEGIAWYGLA